MISDDLLKKIDEKQSPCVVGLDPDISKFPEQFLRRTSDFSEIGTAITAFNYGIIDAIHDLVPAVKPQIAFYEQYGAPGILAFENTIAYAKSKGLIVITDAKRNDIGNTSKTYANGHLGKVETSQGMQKSFDADFLTVNPYMGMDSLEPFVDVCKEYHKGLFVLVKTSNKGSGDFQDRLVELTDEEAIVLCDLGFQNSNTLNKKTELYNLVGMKVNQVAQTFIGERGYSSIGAVIGATYPAQAEILRKIMPNNMFLVPGYGAQGGGAKDVIPCFNEDGYGAGINSSRGVLYAHLKHNSPKKFQEYSRQAVLEMNLDIKSALKDANKYPSTWD